PGVSPSAPRQQTLDDLGTPLSEVTFVVVDLETTGTSPAVDAITEIGALRMRGGELLGRFETFVNPGVPIPPMITVLTGITEAMLLPAPRIAEVLPAFLEFAHDAVIVGHNIRFDISFLDTALRERGYGRLAHRRVDTVALARRLIRDEVPNLRLGTLARHFRTVAEPVHRAYADAAATAEVLHALLERAAAFGVLGLDDLLALPTMRAHPSAAKLALTSKLPRLPGVYLFRDRARRVLYVGKATNLRARVRSYFSTEDRRKVPQLLRETVHIEHRVCRGPFEAAIRELRLIQALEPRFNRESKTWRRYTYLKLTNERFPRLVVTRVARADGASYLGPFRSSSAAHRAREAIEDAVPIRRCGTKIARTAVLECGPPCVPAQLGVSSCPCRAQIGDAAYGALTDVVRRGLDDDPGLLCGPLEARMRRLAACERYEEAAATRDRLATLTQALQRQRAMDALRAAPRLVIDCDEGRLVLAYGRVVLDDLDEAATGPPDLAVPPTRAEADELMLVNRWLLKTRNVRCADAVGVAATRLPAVASYAPLRDD
ncbi:MAG TPA: DEDD exonuclease domain-containing protein, partial [Acidimicrobiia bacterium]|nr:DEDD exonuclease domain-containing protein [Acidimicrobiia bacterium]